MTQQALDSNGPGRESASCQLEVQHWYRRVYALCQSRLMSAADAEDAAQETFVRGLARIGELRSAEALGGWLRQIAHNVCIDMIRRQKVRQTSATDVHRVPDDHVTETTAKRDEREHLLGLIGELPEPLREIILLHYYDNMTYDEMATWLDVARSTVNERLSKARHLLKTRLVSTENAP
jgi:RNA polymerase sigma-70 factor (ECF subfamily)